MDIPLTKPDITSAEISAVEAVLRTGWLTTGAETARFERAIAARCGTRDAVCVSSATAGLELVLRLLQIGSGDEVILPAYTFTATAAAVVHVGATPILADCDPGVFHLTPERVEPLLSPRTAAVIGVDLGGVLCDYEGLKAVCACAPHHRTTRRGIAALLGRPAVLADAAHSLGAVSDYGASGAVADCSVFSFHAAKNLTTGEGGAITWNIPGADAEVLRQRLSLLSMHGMDRSAFERDQNGGTGGYDILLCGGKCNLTDLQAAIGVSQLQRYDAMLSRRRAIVARYAAALLPHWNALSHAPGSAAHLFMALLPEDESARRDPILTALRRQGVGAAIHYRPLPALTAYRRMGWREADFPNAMALFARELTLPLSSVMTDEQVGAVLRALTRANADA